MAANDTKPTIATTEVSTRFDGPPTVAEPELNNALHPPEGPNPKGTKPEAAESMANDSESAAPDKVPGGEGIEGEEVVWEARYAMKNFLGRIAFRILVTVAWLSFTVYALGYREENNLSVLIWITGAIVAYLWLALITRMIHAYFGHYYRLTNRRLFVSTGLMRRRRDMMELLSVKDVYTRQTLIERWLSLGTVVIVSSEAALPIFYLTGVQDPKDVMDLVWHHARAERDHRSVKVDKV